MTARALTALQHFCVSMVRVWRCAAHRGARLPPCTAANAVTAFLAPVRQGAARSRAASSGSPSATVGMRGGVLGERAALSMLTQPSSQSGDGAQWLAMCARRRAAARQLRGSLTHVTGLHGRACEGAVSHKISNVVVSRCGVVGAARLRRIPGQQCGRTSKVERCELTVVVISHIITHKTLGCGGATRWCRGPGYSRGRVRVCKSKSDVI